MERLSDRFRVIAVDLYGSGKTPVWPGERPMYLDDELELLRPVFRSAGEGFHLVGHSYGAAVALKAALADQGRPVSLALFEPVLFSVLAAKEPRSRAIREIVKLRDTTIDLVDRGNLHVAAEHFYDFWMGKGAWNALPGEKRHSLAAAIQAVMPEWNAVFHEPAPLSAFGAVDIPALFLTGTESREPARAVTRLLISVLPRVSVEEIEGVGHMAPVTHPERINTTIDRFLEAFRFPLAGDKTFR
jgi:pimeloyl-ACP methyl ester carboxylesterase